MPDPRRETVSASQASALFDRSPYFTRWALWHHFRNDIELYSRPNERMEWGINLQPAILDATARAYRLEVTENKENEYRRKGPIGATIDGLMFALDVGPIIVEAKNVDWLVWRKDWTPNAAPPHIEIQLQVNIEASDAKRGIIAALVGNNDLRFLERDRDEDMITRIKEAAEEFLQSVRDGQEPPQFGDTEKDLPTLALLYPVVDPKEVLEDYEDLQLAYDIRRYLAAHEERGALDREVKQLQAKILGRAKTAGIIQANGWRCEINKYLIAAGICEPHKEPKQIRKASVRTELKISRTQEVVIEKEAPEYRG